MSIRKRPLALLLLPYLFGCTENFGDAPRVGGRVGARRSDPVGPVLPRAAIAWSGAADQAVLATDRGVYRLRWQSGAPSWSAEHPGYVTPQGDASPQFLQDIHMSASGRNVIHNVAIGLGEQDMLLFVSEDGGVRYRNVERPRIETRGVDGILALDASAGLPTGGFLAIQGASVFRLPAGGQLWEEWPLPQAPLAIDAVGVAADGAPLLAVSTEQGSEVWIGSSAFVRSGFQAPGPLLALSADLADTVVALSATSLWYGEQSWSLEGGEIVLAASFQAAPDRPLRYAILSDLGLRSGALGAPLAPAIPTPQPAAAIAPLWLESALLLVTPACEPMRFDAAGVESFEFGGADLWWSTMAVDRSDGVTLLLGNRNTGRVHRQREGQAWEDLRALLLNSRAKCIAADPGEAAAIWLGSFGLYRFMPSGTSGSWEKRTNGMQSYLLLGSEDLMEMQSIAFDPRDPSHVWSGATEGNGPYESRDGGQNWTRVHSGLGTPGSAPDEDGLPNCSAVRAFVIEDEATWMATFRGGVFELVGGVWQQRNSGLPDTAGDRVDSCCFEPLTRSVDVRDLVLSGDGALLAATGFGVYRDDERSGDWRASSAGITNSDLFALAVHPTRADWILAAGRANNEAVDWLFLSLDDGKSWQPVDAGPRAVFATDVQWLSGLTCVAILDGHGALRLELDP